MKFGYSKFVAALLIAFSITSSVVPSMAEPPAAAQGYWNESNMRSAKPIELQMDRRTGLAQLMPMLSTAADSTGNDWSGGGLPQSAVGKIFFTSGGSNYVCSGALVKENISNESIVLTAGHCVIDKGRFSTNFMFVPNYDELIKSGPIPSANKWYASNLVVRTEFASARQFNNTAVQHDWAFAVLPTGQFTKDRVRYSNAATAPDATNGSFTLSVGGFTADGNLSTALGYPAASPYTGERLIYAQSKIFTDLGPSTWGMSSNLTGGASGGPWLSDLASDSSTGVVSSLNSYKYTNDTSRMYGPKFGSKTTSTYDVAIKASGTSNLIDSN